MICEKCGEPFEHAIRDQDPVHECPTQSHTTVLLLISQPTKVGDSDEEPQQFDMSIDRKTGSMVVIGKVGMAYKATYAVPVGDEQNVDMHSLLARQRLKQAIDDTILGEMSGGKV